MRHSTRPRPAFTLIELMVVMLLIAILVALTASATVGVVVAQQQRNSEQLVQKLSQALDQRWKALLDTADFDREKPCAQALALAGSDNLAGRRSRVIHKYFRIRQELPMTFAEVRMPNPAYLPPLQSYAIALQSIAPGRSAEEENATLLYLILKNASRGVDFDPDTSLSSHDVIDKFNDGVKQIQDAREAPVCFCRFPLASPDLNPTSMPVNGLNNSLDPEGLLSDANWINNPAGWANQFRTLFHDVQPGRSFRITTPVVIGAGKNKLLGVNLLTLQITNPSQAQDNIYSYHRPRD